MAADDGLFAGEHAIAVFGKKLKSWIDYCRIRMLMHIVSVVGNELLIDQSSGS
jgi:hypothetical protein